MKLSPFLLCAIVIISVIFISGCGSGATSGADTESSSEGSMGSEDTTSPEDIPSLENASELSGQEEAASPEGIAEGSDPFSTVTHAYVDAVPTDWDGDGAADGIIVYPKLKDTNEESVHYEGIELDVDIEVWTTKFNEETIEVKDRMVYSSTNQIDSWEYGHITDDLMTDRGIRIPFESISTLPTDSPYGGVFIKIHMPGGTVYEASQNVGVQIRAI